MTKDPNESAARALHEIGGDADTPSPEAEAAWERWSSQIQGVDERARELLRAAFEAGWEAGSRP